jgi:hypothetical protein
VERGRPQMAMWDMCIYCWIPQDKDTRSEYIIRIVFPLQHCFQERAPTSRSTYIASLVFFLIGKGLDILLSPLISHFMKSCLAVFESLDSERQTD